jgi:uncharacterized protein YjiS (DUF1127 family)
MDSRIISAEAVLLMPLVPRNDRAEEIRRIIAEARQARDAAIAARVSGFFRALRSAFVARRARRETIEQLSGLTDRELADIGIVRAGIPAAALASVPRPANDQSEIRRAA